MNPPDGPGFASAVPASSDDAPAQGSAPNLGPLQPVASRSALNFEKIDATAKDVERTRSTAPADLETPELDARSSPFFPISLLLNYVPPGLRNFLSPNVIGVHTTYSQTLLLLGSSAASFLIGSVFGIRNPAGWAVFVGFWSWLVNTWYHNVNRNWNAVRAAVRREVGIQRVGVGVIDRPWGLYVFDLSSACTRSSKRN